MSTSQTLGLDATIRKQSEAVLKQLAESPEAMVEAAKTRIALYDWLVKIDNFSKFQSDYVTDDMVEVVAKESTIDPPVVKEVLKAAFSKLFTHGLTMSQQNEGLNWEATGFHADLGTKAVYAKVGNKPYQPLGYDDGEHYVPIEVSKALWSRKWALAFVMPFEGAFKVTLNEEAVDSLEGVKFTDEQIKIMTEALVAVQEDLATYKGSREDKGFENAWKLRECIKLARIQIPFLDKKLKKIATDRPDLGANFENADTEQYAQAVTEYLAMTIDEAKARGIIVKTELSIPAPEKSKHELLSNLDNKIRKALDDKADDDTILQLVSQAVMAYSPLRTKFGGVAEGTSATEVATIIRQAIAECMAE